MRKTAAALPGLLACVAVGPLAAQAQLAEYTVAQLLEPCMEGDNDSRWGSVAESECEQYITGFTDAYLLSGAGQNDNVCLPASGNRPDEIRWAFMRWAHKNFDRRDIPAAEGLLELLRSEFKCA